MNNIVFNDHISKAYNKALKDILYHDHTNYWIGGGRGSAKSSFLSLIIILMITQNEDVNALILRKVGATLKDSVYNQILWAIDKLQLHNCFRCKLSPMEIIYTPTEQTIYFRGADDPIKIKSIKPRRGYLGITWFEECDTFAGMEEIRNILQSTNRGGNIYWNFYSFNPPKSRDNWINVEKYEEHPDKIYYHFNYTDIPKEWLGEQFIVDAEKLKDRKPEAYKHEYLGEATGTGGAVFENIESRTITDNEIEKFNYVYYGCDFGFSVDPFAFCKVSYDSKTRTLYILDEIYETKLSNISAVELIKNKLHSEKYYITADSAEPRTISEFNDLGLKISGAKKGPDSVHRGIKWLQDINNIVIDRIRTPNAYKEFTLYEYDTDRNGNYISRYPDKNNHYIDAVRYALEHIINDKSIKWG